MNHFPKIGIHLFAEQTTISPTPAINTLLNISHNKIVMPIAEGFFKQRSEVVILQSARILELINHIAINLRTKFLVDEWRSIAII